MLLRAGSTANTPKDARPLRSSLQEEVILDVEAGRDGPRQRGAGGPNRGWKLLLQSNVLALELGDCALKLAFAILVIIWWLGRPVPFAP
jgi:hypothetical protein